MEQSHAPAASDSPAVSTRARTPAPQDNSTLQVERPSPGGQDDALDHTRAVIAELFGPAPQRPMHVRYWDGSVEHGRERSTFTLCINRRGALRRMLLPPSELSIVEAYLSGDVDIEGDFESATELADAIAARIRSPRALATITRHLVALPRN